jgi:hypothetical protein
LEITRRGVWNTIRIENEHLNNVGEFRAFKEIPLPFETTKYVYNKDWLQRFFSWFSKNVDELITYKFDDGEDDEFKKLSQQKIKSVFDKYNLNLDDELIVNNNSNFILCIDTLYQN